MMRYFEYEDGYVGVTGKSPKGMKGMLFIGRGPEPRKGIESICEQVYAKNRLQGLKEVKEKDVPDDWYAAIGLGKPRMPAIELADVDIDQVDYAEPVRPWIEPEFDRAEPVRARVEPTPVPYEPIYLYKDLKRLHRANWFGWWVAVSLVLMVWRIVVR